MTTTVEVGYCIEATTPTTMHKCECYKREIPFVLPNAAGAFIACRGWVNYIMKWSNSGAHDVVKYIQGSLIDFEPRLASNGIRFSHYEPTGYISNKHLPHIVWQVTGPPFNIWMTISPETYLRDWHGHYMVLNKMLPYGHRKVDWRQKHPRHVNRYALMPTHFKGVNNAAERVLIPLIAKNVDALSAYTTWLSGYKAPKKEQDLLDNMIKTIMNYEEA